VKQCFNENKLYPQLSDIVFHYNNLVAFRSSKQLLQEHFPRKADKIDLQRLEIVYKKMLADNDMMQELERITLYAVDEMKETINEGAQIYDYVEKQLLIEPVGIMPLYKDEGYIFLRFGTHKDVRIYSYTITLFEHQNSKYKGIKIMYVDSREKNLANTYEQIKLDVIRSIRTLPNPAVYRIEFPMSIPFNETLLPIAKRSLVRHLG
jgi:hypothetical protein